MGQSIDSRVAVWDDALMPRMKHVSVRLPSWLVDELSQEGRSMGCGMSWAMRRRLEVPRETGSRRTLRSGENKPHTEKFQPKAEG